MRSMMGGSTTMEEGLRELASSTPSRVGLSACDVHSSTTSSPATDGRRIGMPSKRQRIHRC